MFGWLGFGVLFAWDRGPRDDTLLAPEQLEPLVAYSLAVSAREAAKHP